MKKLFSALVLACLLAASAVSAEDVQLRFAWWGGAERHEATLAAIKLFEESHPGVTIKAEYMGWEGYLERLTTQMGSGAEPDLIQMDWAWLATFSKDGNGFYNILDAGAKVDTAAYDQKWLDLCMVQGKLNALPVSFTTRYFIWNKTTFEKAGVAIPTTWEEWVAAGPVFKEKLGEGFYPMNIDVQGITHLLGSYIFQKTGKMLIDPATNELGVSADEIEDALAFYRRLVDNNAISPLAALAASTGRIVTSPHEVPEYIEGKWAGNYSWDSNIMLSVSTPHKEFEMVVGPWLDMPDAKNSGRIGRPAQVMAVGKSSDNPDVAAEFLSFLLTTAESARALKTTRGTLIAGPANAELVRDNLISQPNMVAAAQLEGVQVYQPSPYFEDPRMLKLLDDLIENIGYDAMTTREGAEHLEREIPRLLRRLTR